MRTIKFRGRRLDNGEWIYGDLCAFNGSDYEICDWNTVDCSRYAVDPATVGQFTGLFDKNGKEIYEGDLLGRVVEGAKYCTKEIAYDNCGLFAKSLIAGADFFFEITTVLDKYEIIGNIHDNPELLKTK